MKDVALETSFNRILRQTARKYRVTEESILGWGKWEPLASARREAMKRCVEELRMSLTTAGEFFNRHHTTVKHAIARAKR